MPKLDGERELCQYGVQCYRENAAHLAEYAHPWKEVAKNVEVVVLSSDDDYPEQCHSLTQKVEKLSSAAKPQAVSPIKTKPETNRQMVAGKGVSGVGNGNDSKGRVIVDSADNELEIVDCREVGMSRPTVATPKVQPVAKDLPPVATNLVVDQPTGTAINQSSVDGATGAEAMQPTAKKQKTTASPEHTDNDVAFASASKGAQTVLVLTQTSQKAGAPKPSQPSPAAAIFKSKTVVGPKTSAPRKSSIMAFFSKVPSKSH